MSDDSQSRHDFRNVSQTLILIEDARKRGIERLYTNGMARLDDLEVARVALGLGHGVAQHLVHA